MINTADRKINFFGCPMDCDEKYDSIQDKLNGLWTTGKSDDPFDEVMNIIRRDVDQESWRDLGSMDVPSWLRPIPKGEHRLNVNTDAFVSFIDNDGCRTIADGIEHFVTENVLPEIPCMIGVDHSLTGGAFKALSKLHGKENVSLIVIDSHTDAIPMSALSGAIDYDIETNPDSVHDAKDPYLYNRPDSYNASSFIYHLVDEQIVDPKNLYILGVSDYPDKKAFRIKDPRISRFTGAYTGLKRKGAKIVTKKECALSPQKLKGFMKKVSTPYVYVSVDMDIGALSAVEGVRFRNWAGLKENKIYRLVEAVCSVFARDVRLAGMDITEIDPRRAGEEYPSGRDKTYEIAANLIKKIGFSL